MKIVMVSNFDKETVSDVLIAKDVASYYADFIADALNKRFSGDMSPNFFRAVEDDYKLYIFRP